MRPPTTTRTRARRTRMQTRKIVVNWVWQVLVVSGPRDHSKRQPRETSPGGFRLPEPRKHSTKRRAMSPHQAHVQTRPPHAASRDRGRDPQADPRNRCVTRIDIVQHGLSGVGALAAIRAGGRRNEGTALLPFCRLQLPALRPGGTGRGRAVRLNGEGARQAFAR